MMDAIMDYLDEHAPPNASVNLMADVDGFYEHSKIASRFSSTSERAF
jgi:hypothetical protein